MGMRTEGDVVFAVNAARDLSSLIARFLSIFRKYANGVNGVHVPLDFTVVLQPLELAPNGEALVACTLIHEATVAYSVPNYISPDDDRFDESFGASNISSYSGAISRSIEKPGVLLSWRLLLMSDVEQVNFCKNLMAKHKAAEAEEKRLSEIATLQARLAELNKLGKS